MKYTILKIFVVGVMIALFVISTETRIAAVKECTKVMPLWVCIAR